MAETVLVKSPRYRVSLWDIDRQGWTCLAHGMRLMRLRYWLRRLRQHWSDFSFLVEREGSDADHAG
jgi:outer membrane protease